MIRDLGIRKVAGWCCRSEGAVYQWFTRGSDNEPIPPSYVPAIIKGARAEGLQPDWRVLFPALGNVLAEPVA